MMVSEKELEKLENRQKKFHYFLWSKENMKDPAVLSYTESYYDWMNLMLTANKCKYKNIYLLDNLEEVKECISLFIDCFTKSEYSQNNTNNNMVRNYTAIIYRFYEYLFIK